MSCVKTAEPTIEMPFGLRIWVDPRNHVLDGGLDRTKRRGNFLGERICTCMPNDTAVSCAKMAKPIEMSFGLWTRVGTRKHALGWMHTGATWRKPLYRPCVAAIRPFCQITLTREYISVGPTLIYSLL